MNMQYRNTMNEMKKQFAVFHAQLLFFRYILENDNQTLTLLNTSINHTGVYECDLKVFPLKFAFREDRCG